MRPGGPLWPMTVFFFRMSRSIRSVRFSRRSCPSSSRSAVVSAPGVPRPASISACRTQLRSAVSVRSSSRATVGTDLPLSRTSRTASALNSLVNARRFRFAMTHSYRTFVRSGVSTKPGQVQYGVPADLSLKRFVGATLIQIALGEFQIQFRFQPDSEIAVEGRWELRDHAGQLVDYAQ